VLQVKSVLTKWIFGWSRDLHEWACLISSRTVQHNVVTVYVLFSFSFFLTFFIFSTTNQHQNILTFFTFYITSIILFITIQIKKFTTYNTIQNFFTFLYKFFLFCITSSLFTNFKINNPLLCSVLYMSLPNKPNISRGDAFLHCDMGIWYI
jgi:hypothetical protein